MALRLCKAAGFVLGSAGTYDPYSTSASYKQNPEDKYPKGVNAFYKRDA